MEFELPMKIKAIYENGVLRPLEALELRDGQTVEVTLDDSSPFEPGYPPGHPFHGMEPISDEHAEYLHRVTEEEFGQVDPAEWEVSPALQDYIDWLKSKATEGKS